MSTLHPVDRRTAQAAAAEALSRAREASGGATPNLTRAMANSPAALHGYLARAESSQPRVKAVLDVASAINLGRGHVDDAIIEVARTAGWSDGEIAKVVAHVAVNAFTNYFANAARVDIDFPRVSLPGSAA
jgi:alkylhydroperoxidase family enzyme